MSYMHNSMCAEFESLMGKEVNESIKNYVNGTQQEHEANEIIESMDDELLNRTVLILSKYGVKCERKYTQEIISSGEFLFFISELTRVYIYQKEDFRRDIINSLKSISNCYEKIDKKLERTFGLYKKRYIKFNKIKKSFDNRMDRIFGTGIYQVR